MALNPLILTDDFLPWHRAGLSCLFWEHREVAPFLFEVGLSCFGVDEAAENGGANLAPKDRVAALPEKMRRRERRTDVPLPGNEGIKRQEVAAASMQSHACPSDADWPNAWRELLQRTAAAPIVWTYAELGEDLVGSGDKERSACLRRIIGALQLPKGSNAFWPVHLPRLDKSEVPGGERPAVDDPAATYLTDAGSASRTAAPAPEHLAESRLFQEGLRILAPKIVIMLGASSLELANVPLHSPVPFSQQVCMGILYVLLPDFSTLLASAQLQEQTCIFVRSVLADLLPLSV